LFTFGRPGQSTRALECKKNKNSGLNQYGEKPFEQQQFGTTGVAGVKDYSEVK